MVTSAPQYVPNKSNLRRTVLRNTSANLMRLAGSGTLALILPVFLARKLSTETYSTWAILLQLAAYAGLCDFGIQTAVSRFVAHADELNDLRQRDGIASTALALLSIASAAALSMVAIVSWQLPHLFKAMPASLGKQAEIALLLMGGSFALGLPFSVVHAVFIGLQRSEIPAAIVVANRLVMTALIAVLAFRSSGIASMGAAVAITNIFFYGVSYFAWRRWAPHVRVEFSLASKAYAREISSYSVSLLAWMAASMMISGLDLSLVGMFDYKATAYYAVAVTLTNFVVQMQGTVFAALLPASAVLNARGDAEKLGAVLISSTRYGTLILLAMALPLLLAGKLILRVWVGADYASHSLLIMQILVVANMIRLFTLPYATLLLGTGQQTKVIASPLAEGITNLVASIVGVKLFGAVGVALGTLVGAFVGAGLHLLYNIPRTSAIAIDRASLLKKGLLRPMICAVPFLVLLFFHFVAPNIPGETGIFLTGLAAVITGWLFWSCGLIRSERQILGSLLRSS
jgi:O-antigen/teichoic acid export membrane protein